MSWLKLRSVQETLDILEDLSSICANLGGPTARTLHGLVIRRQYRDLINFEIDYSTLTLEDALYSRQILGFYQKNPDLDLGIDRDKAAARTWVEAERQCFETNRRFQRMARSPQNVESSVHAILSMAARKISFILGRRPPLEAFQPAFGPGVNTNVKVTDAFPRGKLSVALACSTELSPHVSAFLEEVPLWSRERATLETEESFVVPVEIHVGKLAFVPKNAKTTRSIVIEPLLNSFFQKGVGTYLKARLALSGVDLRDQTRNQNLAMRGSINGELATIDLSSASDTVSYELVWHLLPYEWADLLSQLRTGTVRVPPSVSCLFRDVEEASVWIDPYADSMVVIDGVPLLDKVRQQKFSSMGNAYTFELETLIFYALACSVCEHLNLPLTDVSVYGDDIIVPTSAYSKLVEVLTFCGFSVNSKKSFATGNFRESCGTDFLFGFDIRPFYQKSLISDRTLYTMHNWFLRKGEISLAQAASRHIRGEKLYGPDGYGDGHLIGSHNLRQSRTARRSQWGGGYFDTFSLRPTRSSGLRRGDCLLPYYSVYTRSGELSPTDPDVIRGSNGYAKVSIYTLSVGVFRRY